MEPAPEPKEPAQTTRVVIEVRTPVPTPTPAPRPTPASVPRVAAPRARQIAIHAGGSKGGPKLQVRTQKIVHHKESRPIWWSAMHGSKTVASTGTGTAPTPGPGASGGAGTGTGSGAGSGSAPGGGTGGNGSGVAAADAPCGSPVFYGMHAQYDPKNGSFNENVRVELTLGNGQTIDGDFHYPWHYPSEAENPFSPKTQIPQDAPIEAQLPPTGYDVSKEPMAVQLTLKYTTPNGLTLFEPCPTGTGKDL